MRELLEMVIDCGIGYLVMVVLMLDLMMDILILDDLLKNNERLLFFDVYFYFFKYLVLVFINYNYLCIMYYSFININ